MIEATQEAVVVSTTIEIQDLNQFVMALVGWHNQKVDILKHMREVPEGTEMVITGEESSKAILTGDLLAGFKAGIELALMELGTLPFGYETEPEAATSAATADV